MCAIFFAFFKAFYVIKKIDKTCSNDFTLLIYQVFTQLYGQISLYYEISNIAYQQSMMRVKLM